MKFIRIILVLFILSTPLINFINFDERFINLAEFYFYAVVTISAFIVFANYLIIPGTTRIAITSIDLICLCFVVYITLSYIITDSFSIYSFSFLKIFYFSICYLVFKSLINLNHSWFYKSLLILISVIGILISLHALFQFFNILPKEGYFDIISVFKNPSILTNYLSTILPFLITGIYWNRGNDISQPNQRRVNTYNLIKALNILSIFFILLVILLAKERTAWIAAFMGVLVTIYLRSGRRVAPYLKKTLKNPLYSIFFLALIVGVTIFAFYRLYLLKSQSVIGRLFIYTNTINIIKDHFWVGIGYNKFQSEYNIYQSQWFQSHPTDIVNGTLATNIKHPFNEFLLLLTELGSAGFVIVLVIILKTILNNIPHIINKGEPNSNFNLIKMGALGSLVSTFFCSLSSYPLHDFSIFVYGLFFFVIVNQKDDTKGLFLNNFFRNWFCCLGLLIVSYCFISIIKLYDNLKKWQQAALYAQQGDFNSNLYANLNKILGVNEAFLYNYGVELLNNSEYKKSVVMLEKAKQYSINTSLLVYLADGYKSLGQYKEAERLYIQAVYMVPKKFIPKNALLEFYIDQKNCPKAKFWAHKILDTETQVISDETLMIKMKAKEIFENRCN